MFPALSAYTGCLTPIRIGETPIAISGQQKAALVSDVFFESLVIALGVVTILAACGVNVGPFNALSQFGILGGGIIGIIAISAIILEFTLLMVLLCKHTHRLYEFKKSLEETNANKVGILNKEVSHKECVKIEAFTDLQRQLEEVKAELKASKIEFDDLVAKRADEEESPKLQRKVKESPPVSDDIKKHEEALRQLQFDHAEQLKNRSFEKQQLLGELKNKEDNIAQLTQLKEKNIKETITLRKELHDLEMQLKHVLDQKDREINELSIQLDETKTASGKIARKALAETKVLTERLQKETNQSINKEILNTSTIIELTEELENTKKDSIQSQSQSANEIKKLMGEVEEKKALLEKLFKNEKALQGEVEELRAELEKAKNGSAQLKNDNALQIAKLRTDLQSKSLELERSNRLQDELQSKINTLNRNLEALQVNGGVEIEDLRNKLNEKNGRLEKLTQSESELKRQIEACTAEMEDLKKILETKEEELVKLTQSKSELQDKIQKLENEIQLVKTQASQSQDQNSDEVKALKSTLKTKQEEIEHLENEIEIEKQAAIQSQDQSRSQIDNLKSTIQKKKEELANLTQSESTLKSDMEQLKKELATTKEALDHLQTQSKMEIETLTHDLQEKVNELSEMVKSKEELESQLESLNKEKSELEQSLHQRVTEIETLKIKLEEAEEALTEQKKSETELREKIEQLENEIDTAKSATDLSNSEIERLTNDLIEKEVEVDHLNKMNKKLELESPLLKDWNPIEDEELKLEIERLKQNIANLEETKGKQQSEIEKQNEEKLALTTKLKSLESDHEERLTSDKAQELRVELELNVQNVDALSKENEGLKLSLNEAKQKLENLIKITIDANEQTTKEKEELKKEIARLLFELKEKKEPEFVFIDTDKNS